MNHINKLLFLLTIFFGCAVCSCGDGTEELTPSEPPRNFFEVDPSDNSAQAQIRRDFYKDNGIYLLFDDLLGTYTDENGIQREERVDFRWNGLTSDDSLFKWECDFLSDEEIEESIPLLEKYFIPYINVDGGKFRPYSILLVKDLMAPDKYGYLSPTNYISTMRCLCINVSDWIGLTEDDAYYQGRKLLRTFASTKLSVNTDELEPFFEICAEHYDNVYVYYSFPEWLDYQDVELIYQAGFTRYFPDSYGEVNYDTFPYESTDLRLFLDHVFYDDEEEFMEKWGDYPLIIQKYNLMKNCIEDLGVDFNAVKL